MAQDLAHWGRERRDGTDIATLVEALLRETSIPWFRLLYIYSAGLREPLIELMASETRLLSYIDMPIQHASGPHGAPSHAPAGAGREAAVEGRLAAGNDPRTHAEDDGARRVPGRDGRGVPRTRGFPR